MTQDMTQRYRQFKLTWGTCYAFDNLMGNSVNAGATALAPATCRMVRYGRLTQYGFDSLSNVNGLQQATVIQAEGQKKSDCHSRRAPRCKHRDVGWHEPLSKSH